MANKFKKQDGQKQSASAPSAIANAQNYDLAAASAQIETVPASVETITIATTETPVKVGQLVRFTNTAAAVAFVWTGVQGESPGGTPAIADSLAIPPNSAIVVKFGQPVDSSKSPAFKLSAATVQAAIFEQ